MMTYFQSFIPECTVVAACEVSWCDKVTSPCADLRSEHFRVTSGCDHEQWSHVQGTQEAKVLLVSISVMCFDTWQNTFNTPTH